MTDKLQRRGDVFTLAPQNITEAMEFSKVIASSELCPKDYRGKPQSVMIAVMMGAELNITPMQSLQNIAVINGRPSMWGDLVLGLVQASGLLESIDERDPQECWAKKEGRCAVKRRGQDGEVVRTYTYEMAEQSGLIKRSGDSMPWKTNPGRMLQMRARSWAIRDVFPDVLKGVMPREEVEDYPPDRPAIEMPRRASEVKKGAVDEFVKNGRTAEEKAPETTTPPDRWTGTIEAITVKKGLTKGKTWEKYIIKGSDGTLFSTFSETNATFAKESGNLPVTIAWTEGKYGKELVDIEAGGEA